MFTGASLAPGTRAAGSDSVPSLLDSLVKGKTTVMVGMALHEVMMA